MSHH
jgi:hypothetical protein